MRGTRGLRVLVVAMCWSLLALGGAGPTAAAGSGIEGMATGARHTCAVRANGTVWCWGDGLAGQLGDGTTGDSDGVRTSPVRVLRGSSALTGVTKVAAGTAFSCAVRSSGTVWCWGDANQGQLGNGQSGPGERQHRAVQVRRGSGFLTGVKQIAAGGFHACALRSNGSVYCWGSAGLGQVGDGTTGVGTGSLRTTAVRVRRASGSLDRVVSIAAGDQHTCAVRKDGSAWCWGAGAHGQLGDGASGTGHHRTTATRVRRGSGYLAKASGIAAGGQHSCARRTDRTVWCWGDAEQGQLGNDQAGPGAHRTKAVQVLRGSGILTGATGVGAGERHSCARRSDGTAWCWGWAFYWQLGDGTTGDPGDHHRVKPVRVRRSTGAFTKVRTLDGGSYHTCALRTDKTVWCWGLNSSGQLGRGTRDDDPHPFPIKVTFP